MDSLRPPPPFRFAPHGRPFKPWEYANRQTSERKALSLRLISITGRKTPPFEAEVQAYLAKLRWKAEIVNLCLPQSADSRIRKQKEAEKIEGALGAGLVCLLMEDGLRMDSRRFARWLEAQTQTHRDVSFVIGGAFGLHPDLLQTGRIPLSLGPMTLAHALARLVLAEQIFRAHCILTAHPYHQQQEAKA